MFLGWNRFTPHRTATDITKYRSAGRLPPAAYQGSISGLAFITGQVDLVYACSFRTDLFPSAQRQNEPVWYYKLDEIIYQGICNDMHVPLLALDYLRRKHTSFSYADELELWRPGQTRPFIEMVLNCLVRPF